MASIYDWKKDASDNQNSDDIINWLEGQPPSSVNNSARAMMVRIRQLLEDLGGVVTATGAANSIAVASSSPITDYPDGYMLSFRAFSATTGAATISVNNIGAKPVYRNSSTGPERTGAGDIVAGCIYDVVYSAALNGGDGGFLLASPTLPSSSVPTGAIMAFAMKTPPSGWFYCNGQAVSRTIYADLFAAIGIQWGGGDGSTTFNVPDFRGMFLRGWDDKRGIDTNRVWAEQQKDDFRQHNHSGKTGLSGRHMHNVPYKTFKPRGPNGEGGWSGTPYTENATTSEAPDHSHAITNDGGNETRPVNQTVIYGIKI